MKPAESAQIEFIKDCLRKGQQRKDFLQEFTRIYKVGIKTFDTRLKAATKAMGAEMKRIEQTAEGNIAKKVEALESKIMTSVEVRLFLSNIVNAKTDVKKIGNQAFPIVEKEDGTKEIIYLTDKINAAKELSKMRGDYAPTKTEATIKGDIQPLIIQPVKVKDAPNK